MTQQIEIEGIGQQKYTLNTIKHEQFLRLSENPFIKDTLGRYDRGDIDYIQALERIAVNLLAQIEKGVNHDN